jgi:hypothetical protein
VDVTVTVLFSVSTVLIKSLLPKMGNPEIYIPGRKFETGLTVRVVFINESRTTGDVRLTSPDRTSAIEFENQFHF